MLLSIKAYAQLREKTIEALENIPNVKPLAYDKPITLRVVKIERFVMRETLYGHHRRRICEVTESTMEEALFRL